MKKIESTFDNVLELAERASSHSRYEGMYNRSEYNEEFFGTKNAEEAVELMLNGWPEGLNKISMKALNIETSIKFKKLSYHYDVVGEVIDVGAYLSGEPECWLAPDYIETKPNLDIYINVSYSGSVKTERIFNRGAAIIALVDVLKDHYNINLYAVSFAADYPEKRISYIETKIGTTPLDMDLASFVFCHPSFFRRFYTAIMDIDFNMNDAGRWHPINLDKFKNMENTIYLSQPEWNDKISFKTLESARRWVLKQMEVYLEKK